MRSYDKDSIYIGYIENYLDYKDRKFNLKEGFVHNNKYFSTFLKINSNSFFDLSTGEYYMAGQKPIINIMYKLNAKSNDNSISEKRINKASKKCYKRLVMQFSKE